jgi:hypothetical protein
VLLLGFMLLELSNHSLTDNEEPELTTELTLIMEKMTEEDPADRCLLATVSSVLLLSDHVKLSRTGESSKNRNERRFKKLSQRSVHVSATAT